MKSLLVAVCIKSNRWKSMEWPKNGLCLYFLGLRHESTSAVSYNPMYGDLIGKIERMSKFIYFILIKVTCPVAVIALLSQVLINYFVFNLGNESYADPLIMYVKTNWNICIRKFNVEFLFIFKRVPFNWKTPIGYVQLLILFDVLCFCCVFSVIPTVTLLIGFPLLFNAFVEDITHDLTFLNNKYSSSYRKNRREFRKRFCNIIRLHSDLKELSANFQR